MATSSLNDVRMFDDDEFVNQNDTKMDVLAKDRTRTKGRKEEIEHIKAIGRAKFGLKVKKNALKKASRAKVTAQKKFLDLRMDEAIEDFTSYQVSDAKEPGATKMKNVFGAGKQRTLYKAWAKDVKEPTESGFVRCVDQLAAVFDMKSVRGKTMEEKKERFFEILDETKNVFEIYEQNPIRIFEDSKPNVIASNYIYRTKKVGEATVHSTAEDTTTTAINLRDFVAVFLRLCCEKEDKVKVGLAKVKSAIKTIVSKATPYYCLMTALTRPSSEIVNGVKTFSVQADPSQSPTQKAPKEIQHFLPMKAKGPWEAYKNITGRASSNKILGLDAGTRLAEDVKKFYEYVTEPIGSALMTIGGLPKGTAERAKAILTSYNMCTGRTFNFMPNQITFTALAMADSKDLEEYINNGNYYAAERGVKIRMMFPNREASEELVIAYYMFMKGEGYAPMEEQKFFCGKAMRLEEIEVRLSDDVKTTEWEVKLDNLMPNPTNRQNTVDGAKIGRGSGGVVAHKSVVITSFEIVMQKISSTGTGMTAVGIQAAYNMFKDKMEEGYSFNYQEGGEKKKRKLEFGKDIIVFFTTRLNGRTGLTAGQDMIRKNLLAKTRESYATSTKVGDKYTGIYGLFQEIGGKITRTDVVGEFDGQIHEDV